MSRQANLLGVRATCRILLAPFPQRVKEPHAQHRSSSPVRSSHQKRLPRSMHRHAPSVSRRWVATAQAPFLRQNAGTIFMSVACGHGSIGAPHVRPAARTCAGPNLTPRRRIMKVLDEFRRGCFSKARHACVHVARIARLRTKTSRSDAQASCLLEPMVQSKRLGSWTSSLASHGTSLALDVTEFQQ